MRKGNPSLERIEKDSWLRKWKRFTQQKLELQDQNNKESDTNAWFLSLIFFLNSCSRVFPIPFTLLSLRDAKKRRKHAKESWEDLPFVFFKRGRNPGEKTTQGKMLSLVFLWLIFLISETRMQIHWQDFFFFPLIYSSSLWLSCSKRSISFTFFLFVHSLFSRKTCCVPTSGSRCWRREILMTWFADMKLCFQSVHHDLNQDSNLTTEGGLVVDILSR